MSITLKVEDTRFVTQEQLDIETLQAQVRALQQEVADLKALVDEAIKLNSEAHRVIWNRLKADGL